MRLLAVLALAALLVAGCSGTTDPSGTTAPSTTSDATTSSDPTTEPTTTTTTTSPTTSPSRPPEPTDHAPTAILLADKRNGTAPMAVNFTIDAQDLESPTVTWQLTYGDGSAPLTTGTLPVTVRHNYTSPGLYTATFRVRDGAGGETTRTASIHALWDGFTPFYFNATLDNPCAGCAAAFQAGATGAQAGCAGFRLEVQGADCVWTPLPANATSRAWTAETRGTLGQQIAGDVAVAFTETCDSDTAPVAEYDEAIADPTTTPPTMTGDEAGLVPQGAGCVVLYETLARGAAVRFHIP